MEPTDLLGCWHLVRSEGDVDTGDDVEMEFLPNGQLAYAIAEANNWQIMRLTFQVSGNTLITDQLSAPREEQTTFEMEPGGLLRLEQGGTRTWFARGRKRAPAI